MKLLLKLVFSIFFLAAFTSNAGASVFLTSLGNTAAPTFAIDGSTSFTTTQNAASLQVTGLDNGSLLAGSFNSISIAGNSDRLSLTGSTTTAPASSFNLTLFDSNFNTALYQGGNWTNLSSGSTTASYVSNTAGFNFADIVGFQMDTGGSGNSINATLTGLTASAVPEPSRMMLGVFGVGLLALRRRR